MDRTVACSTDRFTEVCCISLTCNASASFRAFGMMRS